MSIDPERDLPLPTRIAQRWAARHTYRAADIPAADLLAERARATGTSVAVVLPARDEADTVGAICATVRSELMERAGLVNELIVIDAGSTDHTVAVARASGATVVAVDEVLPEIEPVPGKGEALWRSLAVTDADIVCWIDADIRNFSAHFVTRLVAPLIADPSLAFVKAFYRRPLTLAGEDVGLEGGRVNELLARPLLASLFPELSGVRQPLAGEYAGRRDVLMTVPFMSGYSVEAALLIDLLDAVGSDAIAQVDLDERAHRNRGIADLSPMAHAIARTIMARAERYGRLVATTDLAFPMLDDDLRPDVLAEVERPPMNAIEDARAATAAEGR